MQEVFQIMTKNFRSSQTVMHIPVLALKSQLLEHEIK